MKTFVIDLGLINENKRGMCIYIYKICHCLSKFKLNYNLIFLISRGCLQSDIQKLDDLYKNNDRVSFLYSPFIHIFTEQVYLPVYLFFHPSYKLISSGDSAPILVRKDRILLILHDLYFFKVKSLYKNSKINLRNKLGALYRRLCIKRFISFNDLKIITVSQFMKNEIVDFMKISDSNIKIVPNGIDLIEFDKTSVITKKGLTLITGKDQQKNLIGFLNSLKLISSKILNQIKYVNIVGVNSNEISFDTSKVEIPINFLGYLNHEDVKKILLSSKYFILPSFYESFGIPGLEALLFKCKVAASNTGALNEVLGNCALYFDPYDLKSISKTLIELQKSNDLDDEVIYSQISPYDWVNSSKLFNTFVSKI